MKILATRFGITSALVIAALAACTTPQPPVNTLCSDVQIEQGGRLVESDGLSVTIMRAPFTIHSSGAAQEPFRVHANEGNSPMVVYRGMATKELWLVDSNVLERAPGDLRLAGYSIRREGPGAASAYHSGFGRNIPQLLQRPADIPRESVVIGRMDYNQATPASNGGKPKIIVDKIHGQPVASTQWPSLYLTVLSDTRGPAGNTQKVALTDCSVYFR
jgi:hypothetical protein